MDSAYLAIILLVLGLSLIVCEVFIPSAGMIAVFATLCIAGSVAAAWTAWWAESRVYFTIYIVALVVLIPSAISGAFYVLPRTAFGRHVLLEAPDLDEVTPYQEEQRQLQQLVGHVGKALTLMNPGGIVLVDQTRQHCETEGLLLEAGTAVEIVAVKGNRLVVRPFEQSGPAGDAFPGLADRERSGPSFPETDDRRPLDFDLPQS